MQSTTDRPNQQLDEDVAKGKILQSVPSSGSVMAKAQKVATQLSEKAQEVGGKAVDQTSSMIRRNPGQTAILCFGVGLVAGLLLARR